MNSRGSSSSNFYLTSQQLLLISLTLMYPIDHPPSSFVDLSASDKSLRVKFNDPKYVIS